MSDDPSDSLPHPFRWYALEAGNAVSTLFLTNAIFFYTKHHMGWDARDNLLLAVGEGTVYIVTSLASHPVSRFLGQFNTLRLMWFLAAMLAFLPLIFTSSTVVVAVVLGYTILTGMLWPILESLITTGTEPEHMSRRVGIYNLTWSGCAAIGMVVVGMVIDHAPAGIFVVPCCLNLLCMISVGRNSQQRRKRTGESLLGRVSEPGPAPLTQESGLEIEPGLQAIRTLALWLSRICVPATYVVVFSLLAMLPFLPALAQLDTGTKTMFISIVYIIRWFTFLYLGHTVWWHARPRLLLVAAVGLLLGFLGITVPASMLFGGPLGGAFDLGCMLVWQAVLGVSLGVIYASSLYFGMVLSNGSTEHGGYHEALIGVGCALGPAIAVVAGMISSNPLAGVYGVAGVLVISILAAGGASLRMGRKIDTLRETFVEDPPAGQAVVFKNE